MIYYPFDDDPPPRQEIPSGVMLNYGGRSTPGKREDPLIVSEKLLKRERRNILILIGFKCGLSKSVLSATVGLSRTAITNVLDKYPHYTKNVIFNEDLQKQFHKLSKTQKKIELCYLAVDSGLSLRFVQKALGVDRDLLALKKKERGSETTPYIALPWKARAFKRCVT